MRELIHTRDVLYLIVLPLRILMVSTWLVYYCSVFPRNLTFGLQEKIHLNYSVLIYNNYLNVEGKRIKKNSIYREF